MSEAAALHARGWPNSNPSFHPSAPLPGRYNTHTRTWTTLRPSGLTARSVFGSAVHECPSSADKCAHAGVSVALQACPYSVHTPQEAGSSHQPPMLPPHPPDHPPNPQTNPQPPTGMHCARSTWCCSGARWTPPPRATRARAASPTRCCAGTRSRCAPPSAAEQGSRGGRSTHGVVSAQSWASASCGHAA